MKKSPLSSLPFEEQLHKLGIYTTLIIWVFFLGVPLGITLFFHLNINIGQMFSIALPVSLTFGLVGLCEKLSMAPIIGPGAVYLASSTGNVQNMKLPAALNAMRMLNCEEGSERGRVVAILAVATSSFVTTIIVFLGMLFLAPLMTPILTNPNIQLAFDQMMPALLGPLVLPIIMKHAKAALLPFAIAIAFSIILGSRYGTLQSIVMVIVILLSLIILKKFAKVN